MKSIGSLMTKKIQKTPKGKLSPKALQNPAQRTHKPSKIEVRGVQGR